MMTEILCLQSRKDAVGLKGQKVQLLISTAILQECKSWKKMLCVAWIDYQIAFDSVPHSWMIKYLRVNLD
jgi:hypothetical protein